MHFLITASVLLAGAMACPDHNMRPSELAKRAETSSTAASWTYEASYDWGILDPTYDLCKTGTRQSPVVLMSSDDDSRTRGPEPVFDYLNETMGTFYNWGYGPAFVVSHPDGDVTDSPSVALGNETVYLGGWHIHTPADHSVDGHYTRAEMHLVHVNAENHGAAVFAIRLDAGEVDNPFFASLPNMTEIPRKSTTELEVGLNLDLALQSVSYFTDAWTYEGSLTSPPCTEGIRWFVARETIFMGRDQMRSLLGISSYSSRDVQQPWEHRIDLVEAGGSRPPYRR